MDTYLRHTGLPGHTPQFTYKRLCWRGASWLFDLRPESGAVCDDLCVECVKVRGLQQCIQLLLHSWASLFRHPPWIAVSFICIFSVPLFLVVAAVIPHSSVLFAGRELMCLVRAVLCVDSTRGSLPGCRNRLSRHCISSHTCCNSRC